MDLFVEKYRPHTLDKFIGDNTVRDKVQEYINEGTLQNLLLFGPAGTGKTSLAKLIVKQLEADHLYINASDENNIEMVRDHIKSFVQTMGFSKWKIVILDEFKATNAAQAALNNIMETYSNVARFILTCNYIDKILPSIRSRCTAYHINTPPKVKVASRIATILDKESVKYVPKDILTIVNWYYPDQRTMLNECFRCSSSGTLIPIENKQHHVEYLDDVLTELMSGSPKLSTIRQIVADAKVREFDDLFKFLYDNVEKITDNHAMIIYHVADTQYKISNVIDGEIQIANMFNNIIKEL